MSTHPVEILISSILIKPEYYPRFQTDPERIKEFVENMECGETFPPVKVAKDETTGFYVLLDGKHRIEAYKLRGVDKILVYIFPVKKEHWLMTAARFNSKSSKPLTPEEIKQIIMQSWKNGINDTDEIAREMGRTVRYIEMILKPLRDDERNKREEKILELRQQGMSTRKIAAEIGLSPSRLSRKLNSNDKFISEDFQQQNDLQNDILLTFPDEDNNTNKLKFSVEISRMGSDDSKLKDLTPMEPNEDRNNGLQKHQIDFSTGSISENTSIPLVLPKRNDFVLATLGNPDKNIFSNNSPEESGSNDASQTPISKLAMNGKNESDESQNDVVSRESNVSDDDSKDDPPQISTSQNSDNGLNNNECQKLSRSISKLSDDSNEPENDNKIFELNKFPEKKRYDGENLTSKNLRQTDPHLGTGKFHSGFAQVKKNTPYPSYLDQIDLYREFPVHWQQAIRAMELVKIYKLDIVDITDEINEPILWIRKVIIAAIALSLMNSDDLNDASSVEILIGLEIELVKCIQKVLYLKEMVCPIAPDMESWFKENLSANDFDMIAELSGVSRENLPYLLKGQAPPPKVQCFKEFPGSYKRQISSFIRLLCEIHEHAKNKMFNHNSAKDLLFHLNRNQTAINEIIDVLRQNVLL
jgi:hypothetical protein